MKTIIVCLFAFFAVVLTKSDVLYTDRFDNIDVDLIFTNHRLRNSYLLCLMGEGKCTSEGKELRSHLKEAIETDCAKCTPTQKEKTKQVIGYLLKHEREAWNKLSEKYDPTGQYTKAHEAQLASLAA